MREDVIPFAIGIKQAGGARDYLIAAIDVPVANEQPLDEQSAMSVCHQCLPRMKEQLIRCSGLAYMLNYIEEGSEGLELGVDLGDGIARHLTRNPGHLTCVDHWKAWKTEGFGDRSQQVMDARYDYVRNKYGSDDRVHLCRMSTQEYFAQNSDRQFDWILVDANHRFPECADDMLGAFQLLKPGGYLFIDDAFEVTWREQVQRGIGKFLHVHGDQVEKIWGKSDPVIYRKK